MSVIGKCVEFCFLASCQSSGSFFLRSSQHSAIATWKPSHFLGGSPSLFAHLQKRVRLAPFPQLRHLTQRASAIVGSAAFVRVWLVGVKVGGIRGGVPRGRSDDRKEETILGLVFPAAVCEGIRCWRQIKIFVVDAHAMKVEFQFDESMWSPMRFQPSAATLNLFLHHGAVWREYELGWISGCAQHFFFLVENLSLAT